MGAKNELDEGRRDEIQVSPPFYCVVCKPTTVNALYGTYTSLVVT
jgi:hypothetical protein